LFIAGSAFCAFASYANAAVCVDDDGDGWGWNGSASCRVASNSATAACVDDDNDGWGWNGSSSCRVDASGDPSTGSPSGTTENSNSATCVDEDGDGWGWDGNGSCQVNNSSTIPDASDNTTGDTSGVCADPDGDGWGWNGTSSCRSSVSTTPSSPQPTSDTPVISVNGRLNPSRDLVAAHFDHGPDPDDGHAAAAAFVVAQELNLNIVVVGGTTGVYSAGRYLPESEALMSRIWGQQWLDGHNNRSASAEQAARRWVATMSAGGDVWVAEGGPSDFTAAVVRIIRSDYPEFDTRQRVHVVQHSKWNEDHALREDLNAVRQQTDYIRIDDGNDPNSTADLRQDGSSPMTQAFVQTARASRYQSVWNHAFNYLQPNEKLDFSDTVELLYILNIGTNEIRDVTDFGRYFLQR